MVLVGRANTKNGLSVDTKDHFYTSDIGCLPGEVHSSSRDLPTKTSDESENDAWCPFHLILRYICSLSVPLDHLE
jgi:hypothetical protein